MYDQFGEEGLSGQGGGMDAEDLFSQLFGGGLFSGGGGRPSGPRRGKDLVHQLKVSLEDLYKGKTTKLAVQKNVLCATCDGRGAKEEGKVTECASCHGQGVQIKMQQVGPMIQQIQQACPDCQGQGERIDDADRCPDCSGRKIKKERKILEVHIDKGMRNGQKITFAGEGDQAPKIIPGDIVIVLDEKPHPVFRRRGDDLYCDVHVELLAALAGGQLTVPHLDDRVLRITIPSGETIHPGMVKVVPKEGMPTYRHHDHGNLFITFAVDFPPNHWTEQENISKLESILPPRQPLPTYGEDKLVDDVVMTDADAYRSSKGGSGTGPGGHGEEYDDDEEGQGGPGVQCAQS